jgi:hypothetical protein
MEEGGLKGSDRGNGSVIRNVNGTRMCEVRV